MKRASSADSGKTPVITVATLISFLFVLFLGGSQAFAQGFWAKKDYREWTQRECDRLLQDSPWAKRLHLVSTMGGETGAEQGYVTYEIQIRSALPVRQAMVRRMMIANNYDKMSPEQKQKFDGNVEGFLNADFGNSVVINVTFVTNLPRIELDLQRHWQTQSTELLQHSVFLVPGKGDRIPVAQFIPTKGSEFQFIFPREIDGAAIISEKDRDLILQFSYPAVGGIGDGRGQVNFRVRDMKLGDNLIF
ncbi:MAG TPA: hypothetical protein VLL97_14820 [Acidobacteriota bacterium]|nr:hypothetical protein [Acidobacteriota bacterium]